MVLDLLHVFEVDDDHCRTLPSLQHWNNSDHISFEQSTVQVWQWKNAKTVCSCTCMLWMANTSFSQICFNVSFTLLMFIHWSFLLLILFFRLSSQCSRCTDRCVPGDAIFVHKKFTSKFLLASFGWIRTAMTAQMWFLASIHIHASFQNTCS